MGKKTGGFYGVKQGHRTGVYTTWEECQQQVNGYSGAKFKKFSTEQEAVEFINGANQSSETNTPGSDYTCVKSKQNQQQGPPSYTSTLTATTSTLRRPMLLGKSNHSGPQRGTRSTILLEPSGAQQISAGTSRNHTTTTGNQTECFDDEDDEWMLKAAQEIEGAQDVIQNAAGSSQAKRARYDNDLDKSSTDDWLEVYTDGACENNGNNGKKKPCAGIGVYWGKNNVYNVSERLKGRQTNNRAEIHACVKALNQAQEMGRTKIKIYTDSKFVIDSMTKWIHKWKRNGWILTNGNNVMNKEDFMDLDSAQEGMQIQWIHVYGHKGNHGNEAADRLARQGAMMPYCYTNDDYDE